MTDERHLDDPALDALLRTHSTGAPPAHVDAAILAAAHRAVEGTPRVPRAWHWWMPLAAAAVIAVVVIGVVPIAPPVVDEPSTATDAPATGGPTPAPPPSTPATQADSAASKSTRASDRLGVQAPHPQTMLPGAQRKMEMYRADPQGPQAAAPAEVPAPVAHGTRAAPPVVPPPEAAGALRQNAASAGGDDFLARPHSAEAWIDRIRALRRSTDDAGALRALAAFRAAYPNADAQLPSDLRDWAAALPHTPK